LQEVDNPLSLRDGLFADDRFDPKEPEVTQETEDDLEDWGIQVKRSTVLTPLYRPATED